MSRFTTLRYGTYIHFNVVFLVSKRERERVEPRGKEIPVQPSLLHDLEIVFFQNGQLYRTETPF